jgi:hypothetical protein
VGEQGDTGPKFSAVVFDEPTAGERCAARLVEPLTGRFNAQPGVDRRARIEARVSARVSDDAAVERGKAEVVDARAGAKGSSRDAE